ncbi:aldo/keto reductase [Fluviicola sp.]|uniref:aldo/keto reductase n=1 Tax=Fluviicola sp. TaxID=1917219 RepID=UPI0026117A8B|nr:aldo/keto reductase [Fluviicola sp.]
MNHTNEPYALFPVGYGTLQAGNNPDVLETILKALSNRAKDSNGKKIFLDTARAYGDGESNIGSFFQRHPEMRKHFFVCTKVGITFDPACPYVSDPVVIRDQCDESLSRLNIDEADVIMLHRVDPGLSPEAASLLYGELVNFQRAGKTRFIGVSECRADLLDFLAHEHGVQYVECAYSPFSRRAEFNGITTIVRKHAIQLVAYSSILRGFLNPVLSEISNTDQLSVAELRERIFSVLHLNEFEQSVGYYDPDKIRRNLSCVTGFMSLAKKLGMSPVDLSLAYVVTKGFIPIPGSMNPNRAVSNVAIPQLLDQVTMELIDSITEGFSGNPNPALLDFLDDKVL